MRQKVLGLRRDDRLKLSPAGLTRITRHPLILPVVPWGFANAFLTGSHECDLALFAGLAVYAVAGCKAQDLRVEASAQVGTVFDDGALQGVLSDDIVCALRRVRRQAPGLGYRSARDPEAVPGRKHGPRLRHRVGNTPVDWSVAARSLSSEKRRGCTDCTRSTDY